MIKENSRIILIYYQTSYYMYEVNGVDISKKYYLPPCSISCLESEGGCKSFRNTIQKLKEKYIINKIPLIVRQRKYISNKR
jgi:hypothetical protein